MAESSSDSWNRKFYTDLNDMRIEFGLPPKKYHLDLLEDEVFTRTIFIKIHNGIYAISGKELNKVFSTFGTLDSVEVFRHGHGFHSKVCFVSKESTIRAFDSINGRDIYDNCCRLELFLVQESVKEHKNVDRGTIEMESPDCQMETERQFYEVDKGRNVLQVQYAVAKDDSMNRKIDDDALFFDETVKADNKLTTKDDDRIFRPDATPAVIDATWSHDVPKSASFPNDLEAAYVKERDPTPICLEVDETNLGLVYIDVLEAPSSVQEIVGVSQEKENEQLRQIDDLRKSKMKARIKVAATGGFELTFFSSEISEVIHSPMALMGFEIESDERSEWVDAPTDLIEFEEAVLKLNFTEFLVKISAHQVFDKLSVKERSDYDDSVCFLSIFGDVFAYSSSFVFDPGKHIAFKVKWWNVEVRSVVVMVEREHRNVSFFVFDPGGETDSMVSMFACLLLLM